MIATLDEIARRHPCLVLADDDPAFAAAVERSFRRLGWDVYAARSGPEARRLARMLAPSLVVLGTELPGESGWLTCDKLTHEFPRLRVVLVGDTGDEQQRHLAAFVGARAFVDRRDGGAGIVRRVAGAALPAAG